MSITYQQAKRIRKTGLTQLIADQLIFEKSIGTAITKAISLKTRGTIKGFTQKIDPLNIVKILTFGSVLGPAIYGRLAGRDVQDIEYFTGRLKPIRERKKTGDKIKKISDVGGEGLATPVLEKIYKHLVKSQDEMKARFDKEENFKEEKELEKERRHKELLQALGGTGQTRAFIVKKDIDEETLAKAAKGIIGTITDIIKGVMNSVLAAIEKSISGVLSVIKGAFDVVKSFLSNNIMKMIMKLSSIVGPMLRFLVNPWVIGGLMAGYAAYKLGQFLLQQSDTKENAEAAMKNAERMIDKTGKEYYNLLGPNGEETTFSKAKMEELKGWVKVRDDNKYKLDNWEDYSKIDTGNGPELIQGLKNLLGDLIPGDVKMPELDIKIPESINLNRLKKTDNKLEYTPPEPVGAPAETPPPLSSAPANMVSPQGAALVAATNDNINNKLTATDPVVPEIQNQNIIGSVASKSTPVKTDIPSVRNHETTYATITYNNIVVI